MIFKILNCIKNFFYKFHEDMNDKFSIFLNMKIKKL